MGPFYNVHRNDDQLRVAIARGVLLGWNVRQYDDDLKKGVVCEFGAWMNEMNGTNGICGVDGIEDLFCRHGC